MLKWLASWGVVAAISFLRTTCRIRTHEDPRDSMRDAGQSYAYAILHAHQIAIIIGAEPGTGAMVSRSADGEMIVPALKVRGCIPVRGSGGGRKRKSNKGGSTALVALIHHLRQGRPAVLAVDGPHGPRNRVQPGIATLVGETGAVVLIVLAIPRRRWILKTTWDRLQIPMPFTTIDAYFGEPLRRGEQESKDAFCRRVEVAMRALERQHDPAEATAIETDAPTAVNGEATPNTQRVA
jgi:lysophospholipid acyltransferase (LPLAT)-like uncharacterized protein